MLNFLNVLKLQAAFTVEQGGRLPEYFGSAIRGIMGHCFRNLVCSEQNRKCFTCDRQYDCPYVFNYCNTRGEEGAVNPFVLYPHTQGKTEWKPGTVEAFMKPCENLSVEAIKIYLDNCKWKVRKEGR